MSAEDTLKAGESRVLSSGEAPFYSGSGKPAPKLQGKGKKKRNFIISVISSILIGGGAFLATTGNTAIIGQLSANVIEQVGNDNYTADVKRTLFLTSYAMKNDANNNSIYKNISDELKQNFSKNGIEIEGSAGNQIFRWNGQTYNSDQLEGLYKTNPDFRKAYSSSTKVRSSGFFSKSTNSLFKKWGISRNSLKDFSSTGDAEADAKKYREIQEPHFDNNDSRIGATSSREIEVENEDGTKRTETQYLMEAENTGTSGKTDSNSSQVSDAAKSSARAYVSSAARVASGANASYCMGYRVANMISMAASGLATYNSIKFALTIMESFSKVQSGEGSSSGINEVLNKLFDHTTVTVTDYSKISATNNAENAGEVELTGAAIQEPGLASIISGVALSANAGKYFSTANINNSTLRAFGTNETNASVCAGVQAGAAALSLVSTTFTGGATKIVSTFFKDFVIGAAASIAVGSLLSFAIPTIARLMFTNTFDTSVGMVMGANIAMGLAATSSKLAQNTGSAFGNRDLVLDYQKEVQETLALDAEVDRLNRSPFDVSSKNTFLGSIVHGFLPLSISSDVSPIKTISTITSKSIASLTSPVYAASEMKTHVFNTTFGDCPDADESGMSGTIYCTVNTAHDSSTISIFPDDPTYEKVLLDNGLEIDEEGKHHIKENSDLAKYISFIVKRESPPGVMDANIVAALEYGDTITNSLPIIGDIVDIANAIVDMSPETIAWAKGTYNSNDPNINPEWETKFKYFAQYVSDMNILTNLGISNANNGIAEYLEEYEKKHPLDNSRSGYLARISGLSKTGAETILALVDYYQYLDEYDTSSVIAIETQTTIPTSSNIIADASVEQPHSTTLTPIISIVSNAIVYNDIRNRSYTV